MKAQQVAIVGVDRHDAKGRFDISLDKITASA